MYLCGVGSVITEELLRGVRVGAGGTRERSSLYFLLNFALSLNLLLAGKNLSIFFLKSKMHKAWCFSFCEKETSVPFSCSSKWTTHFSCPSGVLIFWPPSLLGRKAVFPSSLASWFGFG